MPDLMLAPELLATVDRYAVYRCYSGDGHLLYIGCTGRLGKRLVAHAEKAWFIEVRGITLEWHLDELDALNAERRAIHVEQPKYNTVHKTGTPQPRERPQTPSQAAKSARSPSSRSLSAEERLLARLPEARKIREAWRRANGADITIRQLQLQMHVNASRSCALLRILRAEDAA